MLTRANGSQITVQCACGAAILLMDGWTIETILCEACGTSLHLKTSQAAHAPPEPLDANACVQQANQYIRDARYDEAENLFRHVLHEHERQREALYGLGYLHYRRGELRDALVCLRDAQWLGHPHALKLLRRVTDALASTGSQA